MLGGVRHSTAIVVAVIIIVVTGLAYYYVGGRRTIKPGSLVSGVPPTLIVRSKAYANASIIPPRYTCSGMDVSPPIIVENVPGNARTLALIMYDPDAPRGIFYHWIIYNIQANTTVTLPEGLPLSPMTRYGVQGKNGFGTIGYRGPCPPPGSRHRYYILVVALDSKLNLPSGASATSVLKAAKGHVVAYGVLLGYYER